jgi:hypothetical protein
MTDSDTDTSSTDTDMSSDTCSVSSEEEYFSDDNLVYKINRLQLTFDSEIPDRDYYSDTNETTDANCN